MKISEYNVKEKNTRDLSRTDLAHMVTNLRKELKEQIEENKELEKKVDGLVTVIDLVKEYLTGYESISTIQELEDVEKNKDLDEETFVEMVNRYMKVHDKVLEILERVNEE